MAQLAALPRTNGIECNKVQPDDRPVHLQEVVATVYHNLGIDLETTQLLDQAGRPQYLLEQRQPIRELVG